MSRALHPYRVDQDRVRMAFAGPNREVMVILGVQPKGNNRRADVTIDVPPRHCCPTCRRPMA